MKPKLRVLDFPCPDVKRLILDVSPRENKIFSIGDAARGLNEEHAVELVCRQYKLSDLEERFLKNVFESYREVIPSSTRVSYQIKCCFSENANEEDVARKILEGEVEFNKNGFLWISERSERPNMPNEDYLGKKMLNRIYPESDWTVPLSKRRMTGTPSPKILLVSKGNSIEENEILVIKEKIMEEKDLLSEYNLIFSVVANAFSYGSPVIITDGLKGKLLGSAFFVASPLRYTESMELSPDECCAAEKCVELIGRVAEKTEGKIGIFLNQGKDAGSSIPHIHFQIFIVWPDVSIQQIVSCDFDESSAVYSSPAGWWITIPQCPMWKNHFNIAGNSFSKVVCGIGEIINKIREKCNSTGPNKMIQFNSTFHYNKEKNQWLATMRISDPKYTNTIAGLELLGDLGGTDRKEDIRNFLKDNILFNY